MMIEDRHSAGGSAPDPAPTGISALSDEDIIQKLQELSANAGARSAEDRYYEVLFERYSPQIYSLARYYGLRHDDANDVLQESFLRLYMNIRRFTPGRQFKPYYLKIVLNLVRDKYRGFKATRYYELDSVSQTAVSTEQDQYESLHKMAVLDRIISKMPEKLKEVLLLKVQTDSNLETVAGVLGISRRLAYYNYKKAIGYLRSKTGDNL